MALLNFSFDPLRWITRAAVVGATLGPLTPAYILSSIAADLSGSHAARAYSEAHRIVPRTYAYSVLKISRGDRRRAALLAAAHARMEDAIAGNLEARIRARLGERR